MINYEIKSHLARLLATEDLVVEHKNVTTAQFNIETRVLTLPLWKKATTLVYDMLVGHEVGHALFTPNKWDFEIPLQFVNVVEDARIEKLMKRKYPGIAKTFYHGYEELNENDFFGIGGEDLTTLNLADRCNLYFKVGHFLDLAFSTCEKEIVNLIERCETFDDTLNAAEILYKYCKQEIAEPKEEISVESSSLGEENLPHEDEEVKEESSLGDCENKEESVVEEPQVVTDVAFQEGAQQLNDLRNLMENVYVEVPEVYLSRLIASNSEIHDALNQSWEEQMLPISDEVIVDFSFVDEEYQEFKTSAKKEVNYLVKEFECRKSADSYARSSVSKTGILDMVNLHTYKFNEDLFKKVTILPDGKNHGLVFVLDWSGSMQHVLKDTLKQLYNLVWFCSKVQIPFEVYAFTNSYSQWKFHDEPPLPRMKREEGKLYVNDEFSLMNFLTSKVSRKVLESQMQSLWRIVSSIDNGHSDYMIPGQFSLGGTPLNEALISLHSILPKFQKDNNIQKVHCVILSDGEANPIPYHKVVQRNWESEPYIGCRNVRPIHTYLRNRHTGYNYQFQYNYWEFTEVLLEDLKQTFSHMNFIGIRLLSGRDFGNFIRRYEPSIEDSTMKKAKKNKSYTINSSGYHSYFALCSSSLFNDDSFDVEQDASKAKIKSAFVKSLKAKALNKKVLNEFVELVC